MYITALVWPAGCCPFIPSFFPGASSVPLGKVKPLKSTLSFPDSSSWVKYALCQTIGQQNQTIMQKIRQFGKKFFPGASSVPLGKVKPQHLKSTLRFLYPSGKQIDDKFENAHWRKVKQLQMQALGKQVHPGPLGKVKPQHLKSTFSFSYLSKEHFSSMKDVQHQTIG